MTNERVIKVGMADLQVIAEAGSLRTTGLGSCVGITLHDPKMHIAGMAHVMLPASDIVRDGPLNPAKYADTAIPLLVEQMLDLGAQSRRLQAKMAGGAQMFAFTGTNETMRIGWRNVETCKAILQRFSIPLIAEDTGGNFGRTIEICSVTGILMIRSVQYGVKEI